ncbi:anti-sigma factor [Litchfieldia alkalitelluris]|uniref:hypothetical protein n=1 Tax=Litchfieldia alkalitelluris TaxID=304268 RepID=UPI000996F0AF|nr:hypothetical protein [Litchfieldia alkalitelluris]
MNHYKQQQWLDYINDKLIDAHREQMEDHLYSCDQCLEMYMMMVEQQEVELPDMSNESFTDKMLEQISVEEKGKTKRRLTQYPLFHYGIAAMITFSLMTSGFFQSITGVVATVEAASTTRVEAPVSENLMDKVISWIDKVLEHQKEGE